MKSQPAEGQRFKDASINLKVDVMYGHQPHSRNTTSPRKLDTRFRRRSGLTLVEMMVSVALTLMVVFALVRVFELLGDNVTNGRSTIGMSGNLRTAANLLRDDLAGLTVTALPPRAPAQGEGYHEVMDGFGSDSRHYAPDASGTPQLVNLAAQSDVDLDGFLDSLADTSVGDVDDILAFTSRRMDVPFTGLISDPRILSGGRLMISQPDVAPTQLIDATEAEIIWWLQPVNNTEFVNSDIGTQLTNAVGGLPQLYPNGTPVRSLHRRVLLIRPDLDLSQIQLSNPTEVNAFLNTNDISVRVVRASGGYRVIANSLGDLSERHNRAFRTPVVAGPDLRPRRDPLPRNSQMQPDLLVMNGALKDLAISNGVTAQPFMMLRKGKDVVLSDVMSFDLQVWDPAAPIRITSDGTAVTPSDPSYAAGTVAMNVRNEPVVGAYVDLGFAGKLGVTSPGLFASFGDPRSQTILPNTQGRATYCTWSSKYEYDGFDQDGNGIADQGTDNLDNNNAGGADDPSEAETGPPYPHPIRGMKISMRIMDSSTRQVRQTDVIHDFLAE